MTHILTTETGRIYHIDVEGGFWSRSPGHRPLRLWAMAGVKKLQFPGDHNKDLWHEGLPEIGEHLYIRGYDEWYVSTKIVSIEIQEEGYGKRRRDRSSVPVDVGSSNPLREGT